MNRSITFSIYYSVKITQPHTCTYDLRDADFMYSSEDIEEVFGVGSIWSEEAHKKKALASLRAVHRLLVIDH